MTLSEFPWLESAIALPLGGAICLAFFRKSMHTLQAAIWINALTLALVIAAWLARSTAPAWEGAWHSTTQEKLFGSVQFEMDELTSPLIVTLALLHFMTTLTTARTKLGRFSFVWSFVSESIRLAAFTCQQNELMAGLIVIGVVTPFFDLRSRGQRAFAYVLHMGLFVVCLGLGVALLRFPEQKDLSVGLLVLAVLIRAGTSPLHCWIPDLFEKNSLGGTILFVSPLIGVFAAIKLVLPIAPEWVLKTIGVVSLLTAMYTAAMALVQNDARRFFAFLCVSLGSIVLVGLELITAITLTGALAMWVSIPLSIGGFGLTLRAVEARIGPVSLRHHLGLYSHSPTLAVCFLITGLACVGFPGTIGFIATDLLVDGAIEENVLVGVGVTLATTLNGIAVIRAYFMIFTGCRHQTEISLRIGLRERVAILSMTTILLLGGFFPQAWIGPRHEVAERIIRMRESDHLQAAHPVADAEGETPE